MDTIYKALLSAKVELAHLKGMFPELAELPSIKSTLANVRDGLEELARLRAERKEG